MDAFWARRFPGQSQLYFVGRSRAAAQKFGKHSDGKPRLHIFERCHDRGFASRRRIRRCSSQNFSGRIDRPPHRASRRSVCCVRTCNTARQWHVESYQPSPNEQTEVEYNQVCPGYLATLGVPLLSGREFLRNDNENAPLVVIVNRTMMMRYWGGQNPVGSRLQVKGRPARVVGVVADSKYESMRENPRPFFYVPLRQDFVRGPALNIRTNESLPSLSATLLREVHALDANLALYEIITLQEQVNRSTSPQLVAVTLVSTLGGLALLLAAVRLYGVMSYAVAQSTRELGLRMALGADDANLLRLVISRGLRLTTGGILFGPVASLVLTKLLAQLLFNVRPHDPLVFGLAFAVMTGTSIVACLLPAWRASRTDPARVLRD
ncbi:MAG TPA: FtsX-like permease family protein [Terriglobales bacterium]|nr:FtsX-like permease family protein [Terriglobales bacterium]